MEVAGSGGGNGEAETCGSALGVRGSGSHDGALGVGLAGLLGVLEAASSGSSSPVLLPLRATLYTVTMSDVVPSAQLLSISSA